MRRPRFALPLRPLRLCVRKALAVFALREREHPQALRRGGVGMGSLTLTYFLTQEAQYHRRDFVSLSCSGWEGVGPKRYGRQAETGKA